MPARSRERARYDRWTMWFRVGATALVACVVCLFVSHLLNGETARARTDRPVVEIAVTIDDLPASAIPGAGSVQIVRELVRVLAKHRIERVTGFVIGNLMEADPEGRAAIAIWQRAGHQLGNHSYAHASPEQLGASEYFADVRRMDALLRRVRPGYEAEVRYFRYPFLEEGSGEESRVLFQAITGLGYQVARVSLDFSDWAYDAPYARCLARGDQRALSLLSESYLESARAQLAWANAAAASVLGRSLPQVLLLHANVATMHNLDALLTEYERAGASFITLREALRDPIYQGDYEGSGGSVLTMASLATGKALPPALVRPLPLLELACR